MCIVSAVFDWGRQQDHDSWQRKELDAFKRIVDDAKVLDRLTKQPDCEDPAKGEFLKRIELRLDMQAMRALAKEIDPLQGEAVGEGAEQANATRRKARDALKERLADLVLKHRDVLLTDHAFLTEKG